MYTDKYNRILEENNIDADAPVTLPILIKLNRILRASDESHLWPINNQFNVTERAIRRNAKIYREYGYGRESAYNYLYCVDSTISYIVNTTY